MDETNNFYSLLPNLFPSEFCTKHSTLRNLKLHFKGICTLITHLKKPSKSNLEISLSSPSLLFIKAKEIFISKNIVIFLKEMYLFYWNSNKNREIRNIWWRSESDRNTNNNPMYFKARCWGLRCLPSISLCQMDSSASSLWSPSSGRPSQRSRLREDDCCDSCSISWNIQDIYWSYYNYIINNNDINTYSDTHIHKNTKLFLITHFCVRD